MTYSEKNHYTLFRHLREMAENYWCAVKLRHQIGRERLLLAQMDERILKDIGISHADAMQEATRPSSDIPEHRKPCGRVNRKILNQHRTQSA